MAAPVNNNNKSSCWDTPEVYKHHEQRKVCISRPKYREGRKDRAVKVYTINLESRYVMVQGVPAIGVMTELVQLCALYGAVEEYRPLDEYPAEEFTEVYLVKFQKLTSARAAKRRMDETSFYGGVLHVCYVPEYETVEDTRLKLQDRRRYVNRTAQMIAREKNEGTEGDKEATASDTTTPPQRTTSAAHGPSSDDNRTRQSSSSSHYVDRSSVHNNAGESSTSSSHCVGGFPLLPLPPREEYHYRHNTAYHLPPQTSPHRTLPTEDNMGTLHNAVVVDKNWQPTQSSSTGRTPLNGDTGRSESRPTPEKAPSIRFVPRTSLLENRKRKKEDEAKSILSSCDVTGGDSGGPLIGPKLPEPPRVDMEDASLNTTVDRIRSTMQQVASVPDIKPAPKKIKPRRRI